MMNNPRLSIIIPTFMQGHFIEDTLNSIIDQGYDNYEILVIDGGSTDNTSEVIKNYEKHISYWVSEEDNGPCDAINKGLKKVTGDWVSWQNSDDIFLPGAFKAVAQTVSGLNQIDNIGLIIGNMELINREGNLLRDVKYVRPTFGSVFAEGMVLANQSAFWKKGVGDERGFFNGSYICAFDYDWFLRILHNSKAVHINRALGCLRVYEESISFANRPICKKECDQIRSKYNKKLKFRLYYLLRRLFLMFRLFEIKYIFRGIFRRAFFKDDIFS